MLRLLRCTIALLLLTSACALVGTAQTPPASAGRDFHIALPSVGSGPGHSMRINITAVRGTSVTLTWIETGRTETALLAAGQRWERVIPRDSIMVGMGEQISDRTLTVISTDLVTVNVVSDAEAMSDGYTALPTESLGFDYVAMSYPGISYSGQPNSFGGVIAIIASLDNTRVSITPSVVTAAGNAPGLTYAVNLRHGQLYQIVPSNLSNTDLTGTLIAADKPVAVLSGHRGVVTDSISAINALLDQMVPTSDWGTHFYTVKFEEQRRGRYRIYARADGTRVTVNGAPLATLAAGEVREFLADGAIAVVCSAPCMLVQLASHRPAAFDQVSSDPSMMVVNPTDSYDRLWAWSTPTMPVRTSSRGIPVPWKHYVMITAPTASRGSVRLDGAAVNFAWPHGDGAYHTAVVLVEPGPHTLTSPEPINAQLFGDSDFDAYAMPAGMRLREPFRSEPVNARTCSPELDTLLTVRNLGADPVQITSATFSSAGSQYVSPALPLPVAAGTQRQVRVRIALPRFGLNRDTLTLRTATSGARPLQIPIAIVRDSLAIEAIPTTVRFADATTANPTRDTVITVVNTGTGPIEVRRADLTGPFSLLASPLPAVIAPGDSLTLRVRFAPAAPGEHVGTVVLVPGPCGEPRQVSLAGRRLLPSQLVIAVDTIPVLTCDPPGFVESRVVLRNTGGEALRYDSVELRGPNAREFTTSGPPAGTLIQPGDSLIVVLRFAATTAGAYQVSLRVWNGRSVGGYELIGPLSARREMANVELSPRTIDFGVVQGCDPPSVRQVTLTNRGTVPISIDSAGIDDDFSITGATGTIPPGGSIVVEIRYAPRQPGLHAGTLRVHASPCDLIATAALNGEQRGATLTVPDTVELGEVPECALPRLDTIAVRNGGALPLRITAATVTGNGFAVESVLDSNVAPGADARIVIRRADVSALTGELIVNALPCDLVRRINLRARVVTTSMSFDAPVDFGLTDPNVPVVRSVVLRNTGAAALRVTRIATSPPNAAVRVLAPVLPIVLAAGVSVSVDLELRTGNGGRVVAALEAEADSPCTVRASTPLTGEVTGAVEVLVSLPDTSAWVDAMIWLPLRIERSAPGSEELTVVARVYWDRTMLGPAVVRTAPGGSARIISDRIEAGSRELVVEYVGVVPPAGAMVELGVRVLLGSAERTPLLVDSVRATSAGSVQLTGAARSGSFTVLGVCRVGGTRLIRVNGVFSVVAIRPNPASGSAVLELVGAYDGRVRVTLTDVLGRAVRAPQTLDLRAGRREVSLDVSGLAAGTYLLQVESGNASEAHVVTIIP